MSQATGIEKKRIFSEKANRFYESDRIYDSLPEELKECAKCHWALPKSEFNNCKITKDRLNTWCKQCAKEYRAAYHILNKNRENRQNKKWAEKNKKKVSALARTRRLRMYNLTDTEYNEMLEKQRGKCAVCGVPQSECTQEFHVDHCHKTGKVRGILCMNCNTTLGKVKDDVNILMSMIQYLELAKEKENEV